MFFFCEAPEELEQSGDALRRLRQLQTPVAGSEGGRVTTVPKVNVML